MVHYQHSFNKNDIEQSLSSQKTLALFLLFSPRNNRLQIRDTRSKIGDQVRQLRHLCTKRRWDMLLHKQLTSNLHGYPTGYVPPPRLVGVPTPHAPPTNTARETKPRRRSATRDSSATTRPSSSATRSASAPPSATSTRPCATASAATSARVSQRRGR